MINKVIGLNFDVAQFNVKLYNNPIADFVYNCFYHLQHFELNFNLYDNPYAEERLNLQNLRETFVHIANKLDIGIDQQKLQDQNYLNYLHSQYEQVYSTTTAHPQDKIKNLWLTFHECIHLLEYTKIPNRSKIFRIDFRNLNAKLNTPFQRQFYNYGTTQVRAGQCYVEWCELGKKPYVYFENNEPKELDRFCELAKPWVELKPIMLIALEDKNFMNAFRRPNDFDIWFKDLREPWCKHWRINDWTVNEMFTVIPIGELHDIDSFHQLLANHHVPKKIKVDK